MYPIVAFYRISFKYFLCFEKEKSQNYDEIKIREYVMYKKINL